MLRESLWIFVDLCGSLWIFVDICGYKWTTGSARVLARVYPNAFPVYPKYLQAEPTARKTKLSFFFFSLSLFEARPRQKSFSFHGHNVNIGR
jgi:hypothetical protein